MPTAQTEDLIDLLGGDLLASLEARAACPNFQPAAVPVRGSIAGRPPDVASSSTGGAQLRAMSVRGSLDRMGFVPLENRQMPTRAVTVALAICTAAALLEAVLAGRGVKQRFAEFRLPSFSPPLGIWVGIGFFYYLVCFLILHRLLSDGLSRRLTSVAFALMLVVMLFNAAWNYLFFRRRSVRASFVALFPYAALILTLAGLLLGFDPIGAGILLPYLVYLTYVTWWTYRLWRINDSVDSPRAA